MEEIVGTHKTFQFHIAACTKLDPTRPPLRPNRANHSLRDSEPIFWQPRFRHSRVLGTHKTFQFHIAACTKLDPTRPTDSSARVACSMPQQLVKTASLMSSTGIGPRSYHTTPRPGPGTPTLYFVAQRRRYLHTSSPHRNMHCGCTRHVNCRTFPRSLPQHAALYRTCSRASAPFGPALQRWRLPRTAAHHSPRLAKQPACSTGFSLHNHTVLQKPSWRWRAVANAKTHHKTGYIPRSVAPQ